MIHHEKLRQRYAFSLNPGVDMSKALGDVTAVWSSEEAQAEARRVASTHAVSRTNSPYLISPTLAARTPCPPPPPTATFSPSVGLPDPQWMRGESLSVERVRPQEGRQSLGSTLSI